MAKLMLAEGSIYIYSHWSGHKLDELAKDAIVSAKGRWDDESYATHIIVDQITREGRDQELSWGLMVSPDAEDEYNGGNPSVIIDLAARVLTVIADGQTEIFRFDSLTNEAHVLSKAWIDETPSLIKSTWKASGEDLDMGLKAYPPAGAHYTLGELQAAVGGLIEMVTMGPRLVMVINEEGKVHNLPINELATKMAWAVKAIAKDDCIMGDALLCDANLLS
jgi:hypothetical protein